MSSIAIEWRPVLGYEGVYEVSSDGRVKSIHLNGRERKLTLLKNGYPRLTLRRPPLKMISIEVHRLVALAFVPNPFDLPQVNHIDGNKSNNSVGNLEWCTPLENVRHAIANGLQGRYSAGRRAAPNKKGLPTGKTGKLNGKSKQVEVFTETEQESIVFESGRLAAKALNMNANTVFWACKNNKTIDGKRFTYKLSPARA